MGSARKLSSFRGFYLCLAVKSQPRAVTLWATPPWGPLRYSCLMSQSRSPVFSEIPGSEVIGWEKAGGHTPWCYGRFLVLLMLAQCLLRRRRSHTWYITLNLDGQNVTSYWWGCRSSTLWTFKRSSIQQQHLHKVTVWNCFPKDFVYFKVS